MIGLSLLLEMMWLSVSVIFKNKAAFDTQKGANLGLKCARMRLAAGLCPGQSPGPLGSLSALPDLLAAIGEGCLLLRGREGKEGDGKREGRMGRGGRGGWKGEGGLAMYAFP